MKYMFLIYGTESRWSEEERRKCMVDSLRLCDELAARGKFIAASPLQPVATAATVRVRDGRLLVIDGPFAETTEQLGGFFLLDLVDLDEAIAIAARLPPVTTGTVEIRPMLAVESLPPARPIDGGAGDPKATPFLLLCYDDEAAWQAAGAAARHESRAEAVALARELNNTGSYLSAAPLHPAATATCLRVREGKRLITDGPFAETHEVLGGFYLIVADSRESALQVAARHPGARFGSVEVRPLFDLSQVRKFISNS
jgi:hypothetical protein